MVNPDFWSRKLESAAKRGRSETTNDYVNCSGGEHTAKAISITGSLCPERSTRHHGESDKRLTRVQEQGDSVHPLGHVRKTMKACDECVRALVKSACGIIDLVTSHISTFSRSVVGMLPLLRITNGLRPGASSAVSQAFAARFDDFADDSVDTTPWSKESIEFLLCETVRVEENQAKQ